MKKIKLLSLLLIVIFFLNASGAIPRAEAKVQDITYSEAPMLAARVAKGELPPVTARLPESPFIVGPGSYLTIDNLPDWTPGIYGGILRFVSTSQDWDADVFVAMNEPFLTAPKIGDQGIVCNICESFTVSADKKTYEFTLRNGLKWSDGIPVTSEDVRFSWEDIQNYPGLGWPNTIFRTGNSPSGNLATFEFLDDQHFRVSFDAPYGGFLRALTIEGWVGYTALIEPAHYLKPFHILYNPGLPGDWETLFAEKRCGNWDMTSPRCADYPGLYPWVLKEPGNPDQRIWERNPYYFKVDNQGQQLPYIDYLTSQFAGDVGSATQMVLDGKVDFQREGSGLANLDLYQANGDNAGFDVVLLDSHLDPAGLLLNQTFDDANWRLVSRDIRFRQAVSLAINRDAIINAFYFGHASLPLNTIGTTYSQYDVPQANALLDAMGLTQRDMYGYRKYPDGTSLDIQLEPGSNHPDFAPIAVLIKEYLWAVGLKVTVVQSGYSGNVDENWHQATLFWSHAVSVANDVTGGNAGRAGSLWNIWFNSGGADGEEPPDWVKEAYDIDAQRWTFLPGSTEYNSLVEQGYTWSQTNLPFINLVEQAKDPLIIKKALKNIPTSGYAISANFSVAQMYFNLSNRIYLPTINK